MTRSSFLEVYLKFKNKFIFSKDPNDLTELSGKERNLGLIIIKGKHILSIINLENY